MVLTKPDQAFRTMKTEGGLAEPLIYALIGGCMGGIVSLLLSLGLQSMGLFAGQRDTFAALAGIGVGSIALIVLVPVFIVIGLFIGAAIVHLCLMIVGGANKSFETTFRVLAFSQGSTGPLQIIPVCGGLIAGVWALVVNCIGLARAHEQPRTRRARRSSSIHSLLRRRDLAFDYVWRHRRAVATPLSHAGFASAARSGRNRS